MSFRLEEGKQYAFVGANGAGKTTITKLLTGLYDTYSGEILIDGKELREYPVEELKFKPRQSKKDKVKLTKEEMKELAGLEE